MGRVYASSDWHGCAEPAKKLMSYLKEDDKLYFLGDAIDRGKDGIELFDLLVNDPRVVYIKGNHEQLMLNALEDLDSDSDTWYLWYCNGGFVTFDAMDKSNVNYYRNHLKKMITQDTYISKTGNKIILDHAGFTVNKELNDFYAPEPLWDRSHFHQEWSRLPQDQNTYVVHGHTPVPYLQFTFGYAGQEKEEIKRNIDYDWAKDENYNAEIITYCDGHKIDIDLCTIVTNKVALLDLDTFEVLYF